MTDNGALGRWTLREIIGQGASGTVWHVSDATRTATAKIAGTGDPKAVHSLQREAAVITRLDHPNLPRLIETFESPTALVFETPPGHTYGDLLMQRKLWTKPLHERLTVLAQIAAALDHLHNRGIIHRDVKPAHITTEAPPVLFDFGIAQTAEDSTPPETNAGTAAYMPPSDEPVSAARDAYAFGITVYEILFGAHPLLTAADRDIQPSVLRQRAAHKIRGGTWRIPSRVPPWELPPDLRGANMDDLDGLFEAAFGPPENRPALLSKWMAAVSSCIPDADRRTSIAPDSLPEAFTPAHTAEEVSLALQTDGAGRPSRIDWRAAALIAAALVAAVFLFAGRG